MAVGTDAAFTGVYELSASEPQRNGRPHWVMQQGSAGNIAHLYYASPYWIISKSYRANSEGIYYRASASVSTTVVSLTSIVKGSTTVSFAASPACPVSSYAQGSGLATTCSACDAYQFAPRGSTSSTACKCTPGAGLPTASSTTCAPCTANTFRAVTAANAVCNGCPSGTFAIDGAQAPAACVMPACDQITV